MRTAPGMVSGWHHHAASETAIYVISGALHMEFGAGGAETLVGRPGDFLYVAPGAVHRESNPSEQESHIVVVRSGSGPRARRQCRGSSGFVTAAGVGPVARRRRRSHGSWRSGTGTATPDRLAAPRTLEGAAALPTVALDRRGAGYILVAAPALHERDIQPLA